MAATTSTPLAPRGRPGLAARPGRDDHQRRRRWLVAVAALVVVAGACSSGGDEGATTSSTTAAAGGGTTTTTTGDGGSSTAMCAWAAKAGRDIQNIAYPDTSATYWALSYSLAPGEHLVLHGQFPEARYASFITYAATGGALGVLTDRDIDPDPGSTNPFRGQGAGEPGKRSYTIEVRGDAGDDPNALTSVSVPGSPSPSNTTTTAGNATTAPPRELPMPPIVLGSGGAAGERGTLLYRVYVPSEAGDPLGGEPLPEVSIARDGGGDPTPVPTCATPKASPNGKAIVEQFGPATDTEPPATPIFIRPGRNANNLFPNPDNVYVATIVRDRPGQVIVVRAKAPTFPDTAGGQAVTGDEQVRFWSLCTNEYRKPYPVTECARDDQVPLDDQGMFTFVISTPQDRPANATEADGVVWLDIGDTTYDSVLLFRHMLASPTFAESATKLAPGALATATMGPYAPVGAYCSRATFEEGGAAACGL